MRQRNDQAAGPAWARFPTRSRWRDILAWSPALALAGFLLAAVLAGLPPLGLASAVGAIVVTQVVPGMVVWRAVRAAGGWWLEDVVVGGAIGASIAAMAQALASTLQIEPLSWLAGPIVAVAVLLRQRLRHRVRRAQCSPLPAYWGPAVAALCLPLLLNAQAFYRRVPAAWAEGFRSQYVDIPFHLAISGQLAHRGPSELPHVLGEPLRYHWFSHAWFAQVGGTTSLELDAVMLRLGPPIISVAVVVAVAIVAVRISGRPLAGPLAAAIAVLGGDLNVFSGASLGSLVNHFSPSLGFSNVVLLALVAVIAVRWQLGRTVGSDVIMVLLAVAAAGSKGSSLTVLAAGAALAGLVALLRRWPNRAVVVTDALVVMVTLVTSFVTIFGGDGGRTQLSPVDAIQSAGLSAPLFGGAGGDGAGVLALGATLLLIGALARGAGYLPALAIESTRRDPVLLMLVGAGLAGALAIVVLDHPGSSETYFLRNAAPLLAAASGVGLAAVRDRGRFEARSLLAGILVGEVMVLVVHYDLGLPTAGSTLGTVGAAAIRLVVVLTVLAASGAVIAWLARRAGRPPTAAGLAVVAAAVCTITVVPGVIGTVTWEPPPSSTRVDPDGRRAFGADQIEAARWLRDHSDAFDIVMTNRHCAVLQWTRCDSRRFYVAAYTERRVLVEGWAYTKTAARMDTRPDGVHRAYEPFWDQELLELNDSFLTEPSSAAAQRLRDIGVRWVFVDKTVDYSERLVEHAQPRFETEWAWVLEL